MSLGDMLSGVTLWKAIGKSARVCIDVRLSWQDWKRTASNSSWQNSFIVTAYFDIITCHQPADGGWIKPRKPSVKAANLQDDILTSYLLQMQPASQHCSFNKLLWLLAAETKTLLWAVHQTVTRDNVTHEVETKFCLFPSIHKKFSNLSPCSFEGQHY